MRINISTSKWGKNLWFFIHYMSLSFPNEPTLKEKTAFRNFIISLEYILPCEICRKHYKENIKNTDLDKVLLNKRNFCKFWINLHNKINKMNSKKEIPFKQAYKLYKEDEKHIKRKKRKKYFIILCIIIIIYVIYYKKKIYL
jgi:hypothetical protein